MGDMIYSAKEAEAAAAATPPAPPVEPAPAPGDKNDGEPTPPAPPAEKKPQEPPTEGVKNTPAAKPDEKTIGPVPYDRFQKVNKDKEAAELRAQRAEEAKNKAEEELNKLKKGPESNKDESEDGWDDDKKSLTPEEAAQIAAEKAEEAVGRFKKSWESEHESRKFKEELTSKMEKHEKEIDGSDGRPAFKSDLVRQHVEVYPEDAHPDPMVVYERMYRNELIDWEVKKRIAENKATPQSEKPGASPKPQEVDESKLSDREFDERTRQLYK